MQYGNLKMKEAFNKADDVLATAAKCITDIINSKGHIIVDFADVCTVMKNGGVAILGSAAVAGEDRAQKAIEEAISSPLLNDSDIKGAKWLLININSPEGDHECTMDEVEIINDYLRRQAGEDTDLIMGMGTDNTIGEKISVTIIATGFEHKDPFAAPVAKPVAVKAEPKPEKIVMTLGVDGDEKKMYQQQALPLVEEKPVDAMAPKLVDTSLESPVPSLQLSELQPTYMDERTNYFELEESLRPIASYQPETQNSKPETEKNSTPFKSNAAEKEESPILRFELTPEITAPVANIPPQNHQSEISETKEISFNITEKPVTSVNVTQPGILNKPSNIYAEPDYVKPLSETPKETQPAAKPIFEEEPVFEMKLVVKDELPEAADEAPRFQAQPADQQTMSSEEPAMQDSEDDQKRRAAERIQKLRNLSFNINAADPNNEFDAVPAYVRRNMELFGNTLTSAENFYSKYTVSKDENSNQTNISSINTFLDGKKPD
jgi:cell division protein FtsZ